MSSTPRNSLGARRLAAQQIARPLHSTAAELVAALGAVQAQDYLAARWAVGLRLPEGTATEQSVERAIADGSVLRTHAMRGTWQLIAPQDVRWLLALVGPGVIARCARRYRELELDSATLRRACGALVKALKDGDHLTRAELARVLEEAGVAATGQRLPFILMRAELDALICGGGLRGKQGTWALLEGRVPRPKGLLERDEGLAELARRYFQTRGPATVGDFAWWSGLSALEARAGLESIKSTLSSQSVGGQLYWAAEGAPVAASKAAYLLPAFDEYLIAYRDRDAVLDPQRVTRLNAGGGILGPSIVLKDRVIGTWRRVLARSTVAIEVDLFEEPKGREQEAVATAAARYGAFLGLEAVIAAVSVRGRPLRRVRRGR